jgi:hypothetical protein
MKCDNPKCTIELSPMGKEPRKDGLMIQALSSGRAYILCTKCCEEYGIK